MTTPRIASVDVRDRTVYPPAVLTLALVAGPDAPDLQEGSSAFPNKRPRVQPDAQSSRVAQKRDERIKNRRMNTPVIDLTEEQKEERARRLWAFVFQMTSTNGGGEGQSDTLQHQRPDPVQIATYLHLLRGS